MKTYAVDKWAEQLSKMLNDNEESKDIVTNYFRLVYLNYATKESMNLIEEEVAEKFGSEHLASLFKQTKEFEIHLRNNTIIMGGRINEKR